MAQTQDSLKVGIVVLYKTSLYRVIGAGIGGMNGGRWIIQRHGQRRLVWGWEVAAAQAPEHRRASTSGEASGRRHHRRAALDLQDQRPPAHAEAAHREGGIAGAGR